MDRPLSFAAVSFLATLVRCSADADGTRRGRAAPCKKNASAFSIGTYFLSPVSASSSLIVVDQPTVGDTVILCQHYIMLYVNATRALRPTALRSVVVSLLVGRNHRLADVL